MSGSCPVRVAVGGKSYVLGTGADLVGIEQPLTSEGAIDSASSWDYTEGRTAYRLGSIDTSALLLAPTAPSKQAELGAYLILWGPDASKAYPAICDYFTVDYRQTDRRCSAPV